MTPESPRLRRPNPSHRTGTKQSPAGSTQLRPTQVCPSANWPFSSIQPAKPARVRFGRFDPIEPEASQSSLSQLESGLSQSESSPSQVDPVQIRAKSA
ncbi:hypothetical protein H6P81_010627 [Aristolochia fimbriata]|uniref:Uncharacterized protein n=1 Tax=Aristolochia fimbriata TaxID=158543 RepID=A0AAV7ESM3_ARIFI|nr:hypothetical protein H6P81_010627 [Aristolochia fimbriata]